MLQRKFSARVVLIFSVVILPVVAVHFSHNAAATQTALVGYCAAGPDQSAGYISEIFNTGLSVDGPPTLLRFKMSTTNI
jgi:hypothetical protein